MIDYITIGCWLITLLGFIFAWCPLVGLWVFGENYKNSYWTYLYDGLKLQVVPVLLLFLFSGGILCVGLIVGGLLYD